MKKIKVNKKNVFRVLRVTSFLMIFAMLLTVFSIYLMPKSNKDLWVYGGGGIFAEPENSLDYLMIGNSSAAEGLAPLEIYNGYGYTGYTCGEPWQDLAGCYYVLRKVLNNQTPKVVFLETDAFYQIRTKKQSIEKITEVIIKNMFPVVRYHNNWKSITKDNLLKTTDYSWKYMNKGHNINKTVKAIYPGNYMETTDYVDEINPQMLLFLDMFVELCREKEIKVVLISLPAATQWSTPKHNAVSQYASEKDLEYIDLNLMNDKVGIDWSRDTRDAIHLNFYGSKKASRYVGEYLNKNYNLTDHRNDSAYAAWNKDLATYLSNG